MRALVVLFLCQGLWAAEGSKFVLTSKSFDSRPTPIESSEAFQRCATLLQKAESKARIEITDASVRLALVRELVDLSARAGPDQSIHQHVLEAMPEQLGQPLMNVLEQAAADHQSRQSSFFLFRRPQLPTNLLKWYLVAEEGRPAKSTKMNVDGTISYTCFAGDTQVLTPEGERTIASLKAGDLVLSVDPTTGALVENRVDALNVYERGTKATLVTQSGARIEVNPRHHFLVPESRVYKRLMQIDPDEKLMRITRTNEGFSASLDAIENYVVNGGTHQLFDLSLQSEPHNFMVDGIVVHNKPILKPL